MNRRDLFKLVLGGFAAKILPKRKKKNLATELGVSEFSLDGYSIITPTNAVLYECDMPSSNIKDYTKANGEITKRYIKIFYEEK